MTGYCDTTAAGEIETVGIDWTIPVTEGCTRSECRVKVQAPTSLDEKISGGYVIEMDAEEREIRDLMAQMNGADNGAFELSFGAAGV